MTAETGVNIKPTHQARQPLTGRKEIAGQEDEIYCEKRGSTTYQRGSVGFLHCRNERRCSEGRRGSPMLQGKGGAAGNRGTSSNGGGGGGASISLG